ncbi:hypothetical protein FMEAI12_2760014 [Parafrankia sp. Ea1.12]|nr:hypothetical protein FMEAI12_2760014 [Parafrankia sp. Ea1.12]
MAPEHRPRGGVGDTRADRGGAHRDRLLARRLRPQPADGGRRATRDRAVHGVHDTDRHAAHRGAPPRARPAGRHRGGGGPHRACLHGVRARRGDRDRGPGVQLVAATARLRPGGGPERGRRPALRARRAAATAAVGGRARLGLPRPAARGRRDPAAHPGPRRRRGGWAARAGRQLGTARRQLYPARRGGLGRAHPRELTARSAPPLPGGPTDPVRCDAAGPGLRRSAPLWHARLTRAVAADGCPPCRQPGSGT